MYLRAKSLLLSKVKGRECRIPWKYNSGSGEWRQQRRQTGKGIGDNIGHPSGMADGEVKLRKEGQLALLAA